MNSQNSSNFHVELQESAKHGYEATIKHPFLAQMADGTLEESKWKFYLKQDVIYCRAYSQVFAKIAEKNPEEHRFFTDIAAVCLSIAADLEGPTFLNEKVDDSLIMPNTRMYVDFLVATVQTKTFEHAIVSIYPCFWTYAKIGKHLGEIQSPESPQKTFIDRIKGEDPARNKLEQLIDEVGRKVTAEEKKELISTHLTSVRMEYLFWDAAFHLIKWPF